MKGLLCLLCLASVTWGFAQDQFPEIPKNHRMYGFPVRLETVGWKGARSERNSRFDTAKALIEMIPNLKRRLLEKIDLLDQTRVLPDKDSQEFFALLAENLYHWIAEYRGEIQRLRAADGFQTLRVEIKEIEPLAKKIAAVYKFAAEQTPNFPDVPKNHWASNAVKELKAHGLLKGYPDGKFRG
jgi:hypothetical protein